MPGKPPIWRLRCDATSCLIAIDTCLVAAALSFHMQHATDGGCNAASHKPRWGREAEPRRPDAIYNVQIIVMVGCSSRPCCDALFQKTGVAATS